jgi:hypothetical protein
LAQIKNYCLYYGRPMELRPDYLDRVVRSYFTAVSHENAAGLASVPQVDRRTMAPAKPRPIQDS